MYNPRTEDVTERKINQFREGSLGFLSSHEGGIPVYRKTVFTPDCFGGSGVVIQKVVLADESNLLQTFLTAEGNRPARASEQQARNFSHELLPSTIQGNGRNLRVKQWQTNG